MDQTILKKIERLARGGKPRALDLFSGCGGISLGLQAAGLEIAGSVEFDPHAAKSHGANFHAGDPRHSIATDIVSTTPQQLASKLGLGRVEDSIDVIVGGPPCQAFARVGRSKLREIDAHPQAFVHDPRARLYQEYLRYVDAFRPLAVLMENVPDILNHGGQNVAEETCEILTAKGFECRYTLLNSVFYGVPQMRERMVLIAYRRELGAEIRFPAPTHWAELPPGYEGSRAVALKVLKGGINRAHSYVPAPASRPDLPQAVTAKQAIGDLTP
ncbi:MAG: DNA cytosine methyltransferase, partial [Alcaligenaceae bacterium]